MQQRRDRVQWVYGAKNNRELEERYEEWAGEYDRDLREEFEWIAPRARCPRASWRSSTRFGSIGLAYTRWATYRLVLE